MTKDRLKPPPDPTNETTMRKGDMSQGLFESARRVGLVALDTETTGLDYMSDSIKLCQICVPKVGIEIIRQTGHGPRSICALLSDRSVIKVFHHAVFDLRFMMAHWGVVPENVACTKIISKLLFPKASSHGLKDLLALEFGIELPKDLATSDWTSENLSADQIRYAAMDVAFLPRLYEALLRRLKGISILNLAQRCFKHIPTRVELEVRHYGDVFTY